MGKILHTSLLCFLIASGLICTNGSSLDAEDNLPIEYEIEDILIETSDGATISGMVARRKGDISPKPVLMQYTIYVRDAGRDLDYLKASVNRGYVGVIAYTRGKRHSEDEIWPYETDGQDANAVIDWISKQDWCNGSVGMFGGSYNGFTQWAASKYGHPALKTIVPYVANRPGMGLPMENNVFVNPNYEWAFHVGSNRYLDTLRGNDRQQSRDMQNAWWESGVAYNKLDSLDGIPNRMFQRWIAHPSFDSYWQEMAPYQEDFAKIDIPVLTIDGYFNDSQNSSLNYLREHYKYKANPEHYLVIGPYNHFGAQYRGSPEVSGYTVDSDALIDTIDLTFQWFDYVLKGAAKPAILKDKINYQVMGANKWESAASLDDMIDRKAKLFFGPEISSDFNQLILEQPRQVLEFRQTIDFNDPNVWDNNYYPDPLIWDGPDLSSGFVFLSDSLEKDVLINGAFSGELSVRINKRDFDFGVTLFQVMPDGRYFNLSHIIGRASYATDPSQRNLLTPGEVERLPFSNTRLVSKFIPAGSQFAVYINVNKNPFSQLNYGSGKDVSLETRASDGDPLNIEWISDSFVEIPLKDID